MPNYINKIKLYIVGHKIISAVILLVVLLGGYWGYNKLTSTAGDTRYITAKVERGTIIASVSGSGQVSSVSQLDIKPKTSGDVIYVSVQDGQKVSTGTTIAKLDDKDTQKAVRDADISLQSAQIVLDKLKIQNSTENVSSDLAKAYDDGFNAVTGTFYDLNSTLTGLSNILNANILSDNAARTSGSTAQAYREKAEVSYYAALNAFEKNNRDYTTISNTSPKTDIKNIINETYDTTRLLSDAIKNIVNFVDYMAQDSSNSSPFVTYQTTLSTYTNTINGHLTSLLSAQNNIKSNEDSSQNAGLDIQSSQLSVQQKQNALQDAKDKLADYFIRAPFAGTISIVNVKKGDTVSTGTSIATIITNQQIAEISLNEVDVAKIKIGQKATLTFDAVPDLTISGVVQGIDTVGSVSQGVVTYIVKISFDTQDERVKAAMSVNAAIITDMKQDVLIVQNSAIKSQGGVSYVEMFNAPLLPPTDGLIGTIETVAPNKISVETGLSNDSETEIISGIKEGDEIVTRTILPSAKTATSSAPNLFGAPATSNRGATGGNVRIQAR